jgi:hypothetical protein
LIWIKAGKFQRRVPHALFSELIRFPLKLDQRSSCSLEKIGRAALDHRVELDLSWPHPITDVPAKAKPAPQKSSVPQDYGNMTAVPRM